MPIIPHINLHDLLLSVITHERFVSLTCEIDDDGDPVIIITDDDGNESCSDDLVTACEGF